MPSSMSAKDEDIGDLSNEDIEILYDIVSHASTLPGHPRPFRALFEAYDAVLAQKGIDPDHDSRYLRFLFRMQDDEGQHKDEGLVERFQRLMAEMDIRVECDPEGEGIEEITRNDVGVGNARGGESKVVSRRGSFDSFFDATADKVAGSDGTRVRRGSHGVLSDISGKRRSRSHAEGRSQALPIRSRVNGQMQHRRSTSQSQHRRNSSVASRGSLRINRDGTGGMQQQPDYDASADESEQTDSFDGSRSHIQIPGVNAPIPGAGTLPQHQPPQAQVQPYMGPDYRPSDTQMLDDAETFEYNHVQATARTALRTWRDKTSQLQDDVDDMSSRADVFYGRTILRVSLNAWRVALSNQRLVVETERFFERLETRAEKARNLFLLTKAFTHWAKSAEDEVLRTSVARRHILRTRYFNAWRDITAVNELKIQHFILTNFLRKWRRRAELARENDELAVTLYTENLVYKVYWRWFWAFCERRAPVWGEARLKRNVLERWMEIVGLLREREGWAEDRRERVVAEGALGSLRSKMAKVQEMERQAVDWRNARVLADAMTTWRKRAVLAPLARQLEERVNGRVARSVLQTWQKNAQLSRQASQIDRTRILRNAWTAWNDRLRIQALAVRIDDRVLVESLYKWALASRVSLFIRVHDRSLKETIFARWADRTQQRRSDLEDAERRFTQFKRTQLLRIHLRRIEQAVVELRGKEFLARSMYEPLLKQRQFNFLLAKHEHFKQLSTWATDAEFYVTTTHALKRWRETTEHTRRSRRREAYAQVRRLVKMNLVRRTFGAWRDKTARYELQDRQADEMVENGILNQATNLLAHWHTRSQTIQNFSLQASALHSARLLSTHLSAWQRRFARYQSQDSQADALRQENTELAASGALKKLGWKLWNIQRREEDAAALQQRSFEKHVRAMLRFWVEQMRDRVAQRPVSPTPSSRHRGHPPSDGNGDGGDRNDFDDDDNDEGGGGGAAAGDEDGDLTRRLENWTAFDAENLGLNLTPPSNLDLSFSIMSPERTQPRARTSRFQQRPTPSSSHLGIGVRPTAGFPARPHTTPLPSRPGRLPPPHQHPIPEESEFFPVVNAEENEDLDFANAWSSTPAPPPAFLPPQNQTLASKPKPLPGYLKTPSKRSVARSKRPELPASPEKRPVLIDRNALGGGVMSAPPANRAVDVDVGQGGRGGVVSFRERLREGGFGGSVGVGGGLRGRGGRGGKRVGFG
ncbi:Sfi1 spindle body protein-domain-containing protein [Lophiotrema nucula]|uniref:Sfi1 spindle body protein-domain-containing protein n=1 Tax=Lophiotrema nucula TaxID=690887 RepID=A0A6A5Z739_9PLEO|nr:Sfi1 spindle body protein-domain-containing protein [Lophiotrema nucula]